MDHIPGAEPLWMNEFDALLAHDRELTMHGGSQGVRDAGLLASALARPLNIWAYSDPKPSLQRLAAAYASGISSNHPFVDGNKRTALVVSFAFLEVNGVEMTASQEDAYEIFLALAAGVLSEDQLTEWFDRNTAVR